MTSGDEEPQPAQRPAAAQLPASEHARNGTHHDGAKTSSLSGDLSSSRSTAANTDSHTDGNTNSNGNGNRQPPNAPESHTQATTEQQQQQQQPLQAEEPRQFDVIIFAASSSVGRYLVEELALVVDKHYASDNSPGGESPANASKRSPAGSSPTASLKVANQFAQQLRRRSVPSSSKAGNSIRWAVAGRSAVRLSEALCQAELSTGIRNLSTSIPVLLADLNHHRSLLNTCRKARLLINCAGPYSELGAEVLIQACIESRTHYVDLCHETTFIESMARIYSERAKRAQVLIINGCGFQSMSAECGINFMKQVADGRIEQVKIILSLSDTSAQVKLGPPSALGGVLGCSQGALTAGIVSPGMWGSLVAEKAQEVSLEERIRRQQQQHQGGKELLGSPHLTSEGCEDQWRQQHHHHYYDQDHQQEGGEQKHLQQPLLSGGDDAHATPGQVDTSSSGGSGTGSGQHLQALGAQSRAPKLERKNTQWLVKDIVQFRNRAVSIAWPLQLIQGFQIQKGRGYCWPIDSLTSDESQLIRSEMNTYELRQPDLESSEGWRPIRTSSYFSVKNFTHLCLLFLWLFVFQTLVKFSPTRYLMRKLPQLASLGHVTAQTSSGSRTLLGGWAGTSGAGQPLNRDALSHIKYCQTFIAYGQPSDSSGDPLEERDKHATRRQVQLLVSRVVGPEPNHVATATFAVQAALAVLMERDHLPAPGGVLTPGAAFAETNIIYQLRRRNIKFEVLKKA